MIRRLGLVGSGAFVLLVWFAAAAWSPSAIAETQQDARVFMDTQAWYLELPPCQSLIDCSPVPEVNPYPKDTLHVAVTAGLETARTYVSFSLEAVPPGSRLAGGMLALPVDTNPLDGSLFADQAELVACRVSGTLEPVRGSLAVPPPADCTVSSPATFDAKAGAFKISLAPFASGWTGGTAGLAVLPSDAAVQGRALWHVVFFATQKDSEEAPPITANLAFASGTAPPPPSAGTGFLPPSGVGSIPDTSFGDIGMGGTTPAAQPTAPASRVIPFLGGFAGSGFAYALVWALPLVLLGGFVAIGRALTKDLYRRGI